MKNKILSLYRKIPRTIIYALPLIVIFLIVLLAYYPGILVSDSMVQWNQAQTGQFSDWHPAYNTIYIFLLTKICNNPAFVLSVQIIIFSLCFGYTFSVLEKQLHLSSKFLLIMSLLFALTPINYNFAVTLLKDTLYSAFVLLLTACIINMVFNKEYFKNKKNLLLLFISTLFVMLFRHNGFYMILLLTLVLLIVYRKKFILYIILLGSIACYLLMTTVGFNILNIEGGNAANKYGPISHVMARILNNDDISLTEEEEETLSKFVDIEKLKDTYDQYNMDNSINSQNTEYLKSHGNEYLKYAISIFKKYPLEFIKHYIHLDSFLYSPIPFENSYTVGMFTETDLWVYEDQYSYLNENSKLPWLLSKIKKIENDYQSGKMGIITMRPAIYMYIIIFGVIFLTIHYKNKKIILLMLPMLFNTLSLAIALPIGMTRYVYSTIIIAYIIITILIYLAFKLVLKKGVLYEKRKIKNSSINTLL